MSEVGEKMFHNVDGEVVEYTASLLAERKESRKIVISLSDGAPCCGQGMDGELCDHLTSVCSDIRKSGMEVYGFGIETDDPRKFYGDDFFLRVDKMDEKFATELAKILTNGGLKQFS
jgi:cobalamin biosynthesis protein CobT